MNGKQIGVLENGGFLRTFVEPGKHTITAVIGKHINIEIETTANFQNFILLSIGLTGISAFPVGTISVVDTSWDVALIDTPKDFGIKALQDLRESTMTSACFNE